MINDLSGNNFSGYIYDVNNTAVLTFDCSNMKVLGRIGELQSVSKVYTLNKQVTTIGFSFDML